MSAEASARVLFAGGRAVTLDPRRPEAEAVLVEGGRIVAAGDWRDVRARAGRDAAIFDLGGGILRPAFHDAHTHLAAGSEDLAQADLRAARNPDEVAALVAAAAGRADADAWIRGFGWDDTAWGGARLTREVLDRACPDRPVLVGRADGHAVLANRAALAALGRAVEGESGLLVEEDAVSARARAPRPGREERLAALEAALSHAASLGIARLEDVIEGDALDLYDALRARGTLRCRIGAWIPIGVPVREAEELRRRFPPGDPWIEVTTRKFVLDGSLGGRTAALGAPYADEPRWSPPPWFGISDLARLVRQVHEGGWAVAFHAIGDAALRLALDALEGLPARPWPRPPRVEHVQVAALVDISRLARVGAVASIQPSHHERDAAFAAARLGRREGIVAYPVWSLVRAGVPVVFGSDWPVAPLDPRVGLRSAEGRQDGEAIGAEAALRAATEGPALAAGRLGWGRIAPGAPADLVVVRPLTDETVATFVAGRATWPRLV